MRAYTNQLSAAEIGRNAAVDRMRYLGAGGDELGFRWNAATETGTSRIAAAGEPAPNGRRVNMGFYGNTPWATMSPAGTMLIVR